MFNTVYISSPPILTKSKESKMSKKSKKQAAAPEKVEKVKKSKPQIEGAAKVEKTKKAKKDTTPVVVEVKHAKAKLDGAEICPATGSRFNPGTSKQTALDIVISKAKEGANAADIRKTLAAYRRENGKDRDLDAGYFPFVVAMHPENFKVWSDGRVEIIKDFEVDEKAAADWAAKKEKKPKVKKEKKEKADKKSDKQFRKEGKEDKKEKGGKKRQKPVLTK